MTRPALIKKISHHLMQIKKKHPVRVAIDGVDNAGKTTLAAELGQELQIENRHTIHASIDGFHRPRKDRYRQGALSPNGYFYDSFNADALKENLLEPLGPDGNLRYTKAVFDFRTDQPIPMVLQQAASDAILLFDGVFLLRSELNLYWDFRIFLHINFETALERALSRDMDLFGSAEKIRRRYLERYIPGQKIYLRKVDPMRKADIVIDNNNPANPLIL